MVRRVIKGERFVRRPEIPEYYWSLIVRCWAQDPSLRPQFRELLEEFHDRHEYILSGADEGVVLEYENRLYSRFGPPKGDARFG
jgi:hypothetical protein